MLVFLPQCCGCVPPAAIPSQHLAGPRGQPLCSTPRMAKRDCLEVCIANPIPAPCLQDVPSVTPWSLGLGVIQGWFPPERKSLVRTGSFWDALGCIEMHWDAPGYTGMGCTGMPYQRAEATAGSPWLHSDALGCTAMRWDGWCWGSLKIYQRTEAVPGSFWDALG